MGIYNNPRPGSFILLWLTALVFCLAFWVGLFVIARAMFA